MGGIIVHIAVRHFLACLVLLVVAVTLGEIERGAPDHILRELVGVVELEMVLGVVVRVIVIVLGVAEGIVVLPCAIVFPVGLVGLQIDAVPGDAGALVAHEIGEFQ